jgi:heme-degrading monooxygenase HmoA
LIARSWQATAAPQGADRYEAHFRDSVVPALRSVPGFRNALLMRRAVDGGVEIRVLTIWESTEAVVNFAGASMETAVVEPEARAALVNYDETVSHYELSEFGR